MDTRRVRPPRPDSGRDNPVDPPHAAPGPSSPGEILRAARLRRRISLVEAEQATRIRQRYLQALEDDDYTALPTGVYSVGFLRNYAIFLGVPPDDVLNGADPRRRRERRPALQNVAAPIQLSSPRTMWLFIAGGVVALLLLALAWLGLSDPNPNPSGQAGARPTAAPGSSPTSVVSLQPLAPAASPTSLPTPLPAAVPTSAPTPTSNPRQVEVDLRAVERAWVRATVDGEVAWEQTLEIGQTRRIVGQQSVALFVGNGAGVEVTANGQRVGTLGPAATPVERRFTR